MPFTKTVYMNIYRSGWFHREGKPLTLDRHAGDFYETYAQAVADIDPPSHFIATVPVVYEDPEDIRANSALSTPVPLAVSRRREAQLAELRDRPVYQGGPEFPSIESIRA